MRKRKNLMKTNSNILLRILLGLTIFLLAGLSLLQMIPPRVVPTSAPATRFSAERAMRDMQVVAREPHPAGSEAQARVRAYIVEQVEAIGLTAEIETSGQISNILVRVPGSDPTGTILVSAHYDSHPPAPGAGDNGISVVAMLEALRVLSAGQPLRNDLLFLYTDGEELGWRGAYAFMQAHPEAKDEVGVLLVFDSLPGNAPLSLIETSPGDAWLVRQITGLSLPFWTGSWKNIQERQEMDTDFDAFQPAGFTGMAFENEANGTRYHTDQDAVEAISPRLVQAYGQTMLALASRFGGVDMTTHAKSPDLVFFSLSLLGLVAYPYWLMQGLCILAILALLTFVIIAWRRGHFSPGHFGLSLLGLLLGIVVITLCGQFAWGVVKNAHAVELAVFEGFEGSAEWQAGFMAGAAVLLTVLLAFLSRRFGGIHLASASAVLFFLAAFLINASTGTDNPLTTAWIAWSFIGCVTGMGVLLFTRDQVWKVVLLSLSSLLTLALALPRLWMGTFTRDDAWLTVLVTCIWMVLFAPQVDALFGHALAKENPTQSMEKP